MTFRLRPGDLVEVRSATEILNRLDRTGTLDGLPFMPEMLEFCGQRYRVSQQVVQAVIDGAHVPMYGESFVREFRNNDVVLLEGLRCTGLDHGGCQKGCMIFWKEAWLSNIKEAGVQLNSMAQDKDRVRSHLKTMTESDIFFCQSSEFQKATQHLSYRRRIQKCFIAVWAGNCSLMGMAKKLMVWSWWKIRKKLLGPYPRGNQKSTPVQNLGLQPGDWVEVKPLPEIIETLDKNGRNRGLLFSPDMRKLCGRKFRVRSRAERLITEGTGKMRSIPNSVILEGLTCDSSYYAFGGCPRRDFQYWREILLNKVESAKPMDGPTLQASPSQFHGQCGNRK